MRMQSAVLIVFRSGRKRLVLRPSPSTEGSRYERDPTIRAIVHVRVPRTKSERARMGLVRFDDWSVRSVRVAGTNKEYVYVSESEPRSERLRDVLVIVPRTGRPFAARFKTQADLDRTVKTYESASNVRALLWTRTSRIRDVDDGTYARAFVGWKSRFVRVPGTQKVYVPASGIARV